MLPMFKTVWSSVFKKSATVLYPIEVRETPAGMRGQIAIEESKCTVCGLCMRKCPTGAIKVDRTARTWAIGRYDCIQCGYCVESCPTKCLSMSPIRPDAMTEKADVVFQAPEKAAPKPKAEGAEAPKAAAKAEVEAKEEPKGE